MDILADLLISLGWKADSSAVLACYRLMSKDAEISNQPIPERKATAFEPAVSRRWARGTNGVAEGRCARSRSYPKGTLSSTISLCYISAQRLPTILYLSALFSLSPRTPYAPSAR